MWFEGSAPLLYLVSSAIIGYFLVTLSVSANFKTFRSWILYGRIRVQNAFNKLWDKSTCVHIQNNLPEACPEASAKLFSRLLFLWYDSMAWKGYRGCLSRNDLWPLEPANSSRAQVTRFRKYFQPADTDKNETRPESDISWALVKCYGRTFGLGSICKLGADLLWFVQPIMVRLIVSHVVDLDESAWKGYFYTLILFTTSATQAVLNAWSSRQTGLVGMGIRTVITNAVYRKALRTSNGANEESSVGPLVNLMSVDTQKVLDLLPHLNFAWSSPLLIIGSVVMLFEALGLSVLAGLTVILVVIPLNSLLSFYTKNLQAAQMKLKDSRLRLINEVLLGIQMLKLYGWELAFEKEIEAIRNQELKLLRKAAVLHSTSVFLFQCTPTFVAVATFGTYVLSDPSNVLSAEKTFYALSLFHVMRAATNMLPFTISTIIQASVSIGRLNKFLNSEELDLEAVSHDQRFSDPIVIENGTFAWTTVQESPSLQQLNFRAKAGELLAVVGRIGAGKSTLLSSLIGDLIKLSGSANTKGSVAYVSQVSWIQNGTVRDNILFGSPFSAEKYKKVLKICALEPDLKVFPADDETEIGEKGVNLSGGQKQRIALARAAYKEADIYLLDDPLSAVDARVGKLIFENLIGPNGFLGGKTRILVTHGLRFIPEVDRILVMQNGQILESGSYDELVLKNGKFTEFLRKYLNQNGDQNRNLDVSKKATSTDIDISKTCHSGTSEKKLITEETVEVGTVKLSLLVDYAKSAGTWLSVGAVAFIIAGNAVLAYSYVWLADWSTAADIEAKIDGVSGMGTTRKYLTGYCVLGLAQGITLLLGSFSLGLGALKASGRLHSMALGRVLRSPTSYFERTPSGRLLSRFARDIDTTDNVLPFNLRGTLNTVLKVIGTFIVISGTTPSSLLFIIPTSIGYFLLQRFYVASSQQLRRLESVSIAPIYSYFGESLAGRSTIRAFQVQDDSIRKFEALVDLNCRAYFPLIISNIWVFLRVDLMGSLFVLFTCLSTLLSRGTLPSGSAGLVVAYSVQAVLGLNFMVKSTSDLESNVVAVERMKELTETPQEANWENPETDPGQAWPESGSITFDNYSTRYRETLGLVLKRISFSVKPGEKNDLYKHMSFESCVELLLKKIAFGLKNVYIGRHNNLWQLKQRLAKLL